MNIRIIDIILPNTTREDKEACIVDDVESVTGIKIKDFAACLQHHYQSESVDYWRNGFMKCWMSKITHCAIAVNDKDIGGIMLYIEKDYNSTIYIRILCSKNHCGGMLLKYLIDKYPDHSITVNSEKKAVGFYEKYGFMKRMDIAPENGMYPFMSRGVFDANELVTRNYLLDMFRYLLSLAFRL
jgi:hypothetical protein